jgi:hypothetical protein
VTPNIAQANRVERQTLGQEMTEIATSWTSDALRKHGWFQLVTLTESAILAGGEPQQHSALSHNPFNLARSKRTSLERSGVDFTGTDHLVKGAPTLKYLKLT